MQNSEVSYVRCLIGRNEKKFDYINRVVKRFRFRSTRVHGHTLPLSLLCITMILRVRRNFLKLLRSLTVASEPGLCVDVLCMSRTQRVVGDNSHTAYHQRLTLIRWYCWMKRPGLTLHDHVHETGSTDVLLHIGGWRVSVSPTLVESSLTMAGPC